jgi:hypothetical protein
MGRGKMAIKNMVFIGMLVAGTVIAAAPASARTLKVGVDSLKNGDMMDNKFAF